VLLVLVFPFWGGSRAAAQTRPFATPTPTLSSVSLREKEKEDIYQGYARLFVLGHILSRAFGLGGLMPESINLDLFAQQELLAEAGDFYVYRPGKRGDIMWPLIIPTIPKEPVTPPTSTPIPEPLEPFEDTPTPTPTATPTPTEVIPPPLKLQVVSHSSTGDLVMINNQMLTVGDSIEQARITEIGSHFAKIKYFGASFFVTRDGTVKPEDFREEDLLFN